MPNWCENRISLIHDDPEMINRAEKAFKEGRFLEEFIPFPDGKWEYDWCVENWGTKWDVRGEFEITESEPSGGSGFFDSAWGPPIEAMRKLTELGFDVVLYYYESGVGFVGKYSSDDDDESYNVDFSDENWADNVDEELIEEFDLKTEYENWLEYYKEEEDEP
jgi:hypothetical protein